MEKKERKKRLHSFIFRLRVSLCFRTNANAEIRATQTEREREREKEGSRTPVVVFAGSYAKHAPFVYVKVTAKREREREGRVANTSSSFCGLVRETRAFCLRKGNSKERERSSF